MSTPRTKLVCPNYQEVKEKDNIDEKVKETEKLIDEYNTSSRELKKNYDKSQEGINEIYRRVTEELNSRRELLLGECKKRYDVHNDQIDDYIKKLELYKDNIIKAENDMLRSVEEQEGNNRVERNVKMMADALSQEPKVREVPIDIKFDAVGFDSVNTKIKQAGKIILNSLGTGKLYGKQLKTLNVPKLSQLTIISVKRVKQSPEKLEIKYCIKNDVKENNDIEPLSVILNNSKIEFEFLQNDETKTDEICYFKDSGEEKEEKEENCPGEMDSNFFKYSTNLNNDNNNNNNKTIIVDERSFALDKTIQIRGRIIYERNKDNLFLPKQEKDDYDVKSQTFSGQWSLAHNVGIAVFVMFNNEKKSIELTKSECSMESILNKIKETFNGFDSKKSWKLSLKNIDNDNVIIEDLLSDQNQQIDSLSIFNDAIIKIELNNISSKLSLKLNFYIEYTVNGKVIKKRIFKEINDIDTLRTEIKKKFEKEVPIKDNFKIILKSTNVEITEESQLPQLIPAEKSQEPLVIIQ